MNRFLLFIVGLVALLPLGCRTGQVVPNPSMEGDPGPLQKHWESHHAGVERHWLVPCVHHFGDESPDHGISEISIERTPCYGLCPTYTLTLKSDGSVVYVGQANVERLGRHTGRIDRESFDYLASLALDVGFFDELENFYGCAVTDQETVYTSMVRNGERKTIKHYAPDLSGPVRLHWLESTIDLWGHDLIEWD